MLIGNWSFGDPKLLSNATVCFDSLFGDSIGGDGIGSLGVFDFSLLCSRMLEQIRKRERRKNVCLFAFCKWACY